MYASLAEAGHILLQLLRRRHVGLRANAISSSSPVRAGHRPRPCRGRRMAALTGFGYSLVYPALGVEVVRSVPPQNQGLAMGAYTAFLNVALGFGMPVLGFLAERAGLGSAFVASALAAPGTACRRMSRSSRLRRRAQPTAYFAGGTCDPILLQSLQRNNIVATISYVIGISTWAARPSARSR